jgi:crotonobetaine/carnitine-CoA ligase
MYKVGAAKAAGVTDRSSWAVDRLPFYAVPRYIEFRAALPWSETGRATKRLLKEEGVTAATWDREAAGLTFERR